MKCIHFSSAGILAGLATMLECLGHDAEDYQIAFGMEAPWLMLQEDGQFLAGQRLYEPTWLNLYLVPRGFRLVDARLPKENIPLFLQNHLPAMLQLHIDRGIHHPVVCRGYDHGRYHIDNVKTILSSEPDHLSLSKPMLLRRLDDEVRVLTLEECPPEPVDFIPLLTRSLQTLARYEQELMNLCSQTVTREDLHTMHTPLLRALMVDMLPLVQLLQQPTLYEELRQLQHDYRHIFTRNSSAAVVLSERLPRSSIRKCIVWLMENVEDRLYFHGATEKQIADIHNCISQRHRLL